MIYLIVYVMSMVLYINGAIEVSELIIIDLLTAMWCSFNDYVSMLRKGMFDDGRDKD